MEYFGSLYHLQITFATCTKERKRNWGLSQQKPFEEAKNSWHLIDHWCIMFWRKLVLACDVLSDSLDMSDFLSKNITEWPSYKIIGTKVGIRLCDLVTSVEEVISFSVQTSQIGTRLNIKH